MGGLKVKSSTPCLFVCCPLTPGGNIQVFSSNMLHHVHHPDAIFICRLFGGGLMVSRRSFYFTENSSFLWLILPLTSNISNIVCGHFIRWYVKH